DEMPARFGLEARQLWITQLLVSLPISPGDGVEQAPVEGENFLCVGHHAVLSSKPRPNSFSRHSSRSRQRARSAQVGSCTARKSSSVARARPAAASLWESRAINSRSSRVKNMASRL